MPVIADARIEPDDRGKGGTRLLGRPDQLAGAGFPGKVFRLHRFQVGQRQRSRSDIHAAPPLVRNTCQHSASAWSGWS